MSAGWTAGSVRAKALATRTLGVSEGGSLARTGDLHAGVAALGRTPYGHDVSPSDDLAAAQHGVAATLLWHLRVLAGWVPRRGAQMIRALAAGFEIANVDGHVAAVTGRAASPAYVLGSLQTAWPRLAATRSLDGLRAALAASAWGDPGAATPGEIHLAMTLAWAEQITAAVPTAGEWARAAAAVTVAREGLLGRIPLNGPTAARASRLLGPTTVQALTGPAATPERVADSLPRALRWLWTDVTRPEDLWRAEAAWWRRVEGEAAALLTRPLFGADCVVGAAATLAVDAWRTRAALALAAGIGAGAHSPRGGSPFEVLDELA